MFVIKIENVEGVVIKPGASPSGKYVKSYDPDGNCGLGDIVITEDPTKALKFESAEDAIRLWKAQSKVCPIRPDGRPNRPLTACTVSIEKCE